MRIVISGMVGVLLAGALLLLVNSKTVGRQPVRPEPIGYAGRPITYTVQGDSLQVVSKQFFLAARPNWRMASFSAKGGRRAPEELQLLRSQRLGQVVIVSVGTNDWFRPIAEFTAALDNIINLVGPDRCLVMATVYDHRPVDEINAVLQSRASRLGSSRFQLVHWAERVKGGAIRLADGVHPGTRRDHRFRTQLLVEAAERCLEARDEK